MQTARYDEAESVWVWEYPTGEEEGGHHDLFMDPGQQVWVTLQI